MGIVETWVREKPIRTFLARLSQRRAEAAAAYIAASSAAAAADGDASIPQLSSIANSVVSRCSRILDIATENLQQSFENDFPDNCKEQNTYSRELLEYCCYKALHEVTTHPDYLADKNLRRLMFDMLLAWESPSAQDEFLVNNSTSCNSLETEDEDEGSTFYANSTRLAVQVSFIWSLSLFHPQPHLCCAVCTYTSQSTCVFWVDDNKTLGLNAFARIAPSCPIIADLVTVHNLFDAPTCLSGGRLHFLVYDKYLKSLDRELRSVKSIMQSPLSLGVHLDAGECILAIEGDRPIHPVLQHTEIAAWPGRLVLTTHALYFQSIRVGYGDKIVKYDLATDSNEVIKRDLTGPLGVSSL